MELQGKKIAFLGDSITEGAGTSSIENVYWRRFVSDGAEVFGFGVSGSRIAPQPGITDFVGADEHYLIRAKRIEKGVDAIIVFGGTNDYGHGNAPFGEIGDGDPNTFCGAFYELLSYLMKNHPTARIVVMTPSHRLNEYRNVNERGVRCQPLCDYVEAEREIAEMLSVPVLDLYRVMGVSPEIDEQREIYMPDGLHPSDLGNERIYSLLRNFLLSL